MTGDTNHPFTAEQFNALSREERQTVLAVAEYLTDNTGSSIEISDEELSSALNLMKTKRRAGYKPFRELARYGPIPLGGAVQTGAGRLSFRAIVHVAGINMFWRSSEQAIRGCVRSALGIAREQGYHSIAFPLIGAGTGG